MIERIATIKRTSEILQSNGINPKSRYGQNFMISPKIPELISNYNQITKDTLVIEIGPGLGALTQFLLEKSRKVVCYEIDNQLASILKDSLKEYDNLEIINQDFLKADLSLLDLDNYSNIVVVSNLPYYITSEILIKLLKNEIKFNILAMMQKEVAHRILNGTKKDINELVIYSKLFGNVSKFSEVSKNDFFPRPNVDSTVLLFEKNDKMFKDQYCNIIDTLLKQRRKTIINNLNSLCGYRLNNVLTNKIFLEANINVKTRIDELDINQIINLIEVIKKYTCLNCCGKLNLGLKVYPNEDGMHKLSSIFVPINIYNNVNVYLLEDKQIIRQGDAKDNLLIDKLIVSLLKHKLFDYGLYINIEKNIPENSGLGGGSSVIGHLVSLLQSIYGFTDDIAQEILLEVGSDCFYFKEPLVKFLENSIVNYKNINLDLDFNILLVKPSTGNNTKEVYDELDKSKYEDKPFDLIKYLTNYDGFIKYIHNDLQNPAISKNHEISDTFSQLERYNFDYFGITGSGSCIYCLDKDINKLKEASKYFEAKGLFNRIVKIIK